MALKDFLARFPLIKNPKTSQFVSCVSTSDGRWYFIQLRHKYKKPLSWLRDRTWHVYILPSSAMSGKLIADDQWWDLSIMKLWHS